MTTAQQTHLAVRLAEQLQTQPAFAELADRLLALGGDTVVPRDEPDLDQLLADGQLIDLPVRTRPGKPCNCHANSAALWRRNPGRYTINTGWALGEDGLWRQHSWCAADGNLIETTTRRSLYYGVAVTGEDAAAFARNNQ